MALAAFTGAVLRLIGDAESTAIGAGAGLAAASLAWLPVTRRWNARGHLCWSASIFLFAVYLAFVLDWTFASGLGVAGTIGGLLLWGFEVFAAILACAYLWEICDALGSEHWRRRISATSESGPSDHLPFVSLHVPAHNEPPDMVIDTLRSLLRLDYPQYEVVVIDDNTEDEGALAPGQGLVRPARGQVRAPGGLAWLQVGGAELRAARADRPPRGDHRRGGLRLPAPAGVPAPLRAAVRR